MKEEIIKNLKIKNIKELKELEKLSDLAINQLTILLSKDQTHEN